MNSLQELSDSFNAHVWGIEKPEIMQREIFFRAWSKKTKKMYTKMVGIHWHYSHDGVLAIVERRDPIEDKDVHHNIQPKDCIIMEYAGFSDIHGNKVFEGDICKVKSIHNFHSDLLNEFKKEKGLTTINGIGSHFTGIVRVDLLRGVMFENVKTGYQEPMFTRNRDIRSNYKGLEIIGNIYED